MTYPVFSTGDVFYSSDANAIGLWLVKTQTVGTAVSSVIVTGAFSANYDNYKITYTGGSSSAGGEISFTLRDGASELTNSWYYTVFGYTYLGAVFNGGLNNAGATVVGGKDTNWASAIFDVTNPYKTLRKNVHGVTFATGTYNAGSGGISTSTAAWPDFKLSASAGTLTGGTIRVYGYRN